MTSKRRNIAGISSPTQRLKLMKLMKYSAPLKFYWWEVSYKGEKKIALLTIKKWTPNKWNKSVFHKKCTKTQHSGDQPFVMSQRALIALSGKLISIEASSKQAYSSAHDKRLMSNIFFLQKAVNRGLNMQLSKKFPRLLWEATSPNFFFS